MIEPPTKYGTIINICWGSFLIRNLHQSNLSFKKEKCMSKKIDWNKNQPIIFHLRRVLPSVFPVLRTPGHGQHSSGIGGYVNRTHRFDDQLSPHAQGRAADIYLNANDIGEKTIGDGLFYMFINNADNLGIDNVIWNRQIWSISKGGPRSYTVGKEHRDHIHVEFTKEGSQEKPASLLRCVEGVRIVILRRIRSKIATEGKTYCKEIGWLPAQ